MAVIILTTGMFSVHIQVSNPTQMERRKEMFHFNDALNTFYFRLYGVRYMVKDHSDSERRNPLQQGFFYMHHPTEGIKHTTSFVRGALAGTRNSSIVPP